jgi:DNA topoisomerase-6 subunit A
MLYRLHNELKLPVYCLLDNDPWGYYIYSVIKQGSINLAYESRRMAIPPVRFLGLRSNDFERCQLSSSVQIKLNDQDIKRAKQIAQYPWFANKKPWQKEIDLMLKNGFKLEVEALISKDISYVTEVYVPARLEEAAFLDCAISGHYSNPKFELRIGVQ